LCTQLLPYPTLVRAKRVQCRRSVTVPPRLSPAVPGWLSSRDRTLGLLLSRTRRQSQFHPAGARQVVQEPVDRARVEARLEAHRRSEEDTSALHSREK